MTQSESELDLRSQVPSLVADGSQPAPVAIVDVFPSQVDVVPSPLDRLRRWLAKLGPGLITGAADDDPSGITTYSMAGAAYGFQYLWTAILVFPLLVAVQLMCARLGMVTGLGLGSVLRSHYPKWVLWVACALLLVANTFQIAADLSGMGEVLAMIAPISARQWPPMIAALFFVVMTWSSYRSMIHLFKWLTLALLAYVGAAAMAKPDWSAVARGTFVPQIEWSAGGVATLVAILGSAISPYILFWQTGQMVEDEKLLGRRTIRQRRGATTNELNFARADVIVGMTVACGVMYFIMLTCGGTLYPAGERAIETAPAAAAALRPLAGEGAFVLFSLGFIGAGLLGVPVLAGSAAYALSEALRVRHASLLYAPAKAPQFYFLVGLILAAGATLTRVGLTPVQMLFWAAVLNGVLAAPLILLVVLLTSNSKVMRQHVISFPLKLVGGLAAAILALATLNLLWFGLRASTW